MPREQTYTAFVLKRTDFNETDQILTLFTKEDGKLRCLVKAAKLPTSKLQPALQPLFQVSVTLAGNGGLPKVINAQAQRVYAKVLEDPKLQCWYLISELLLKGLGDGASNEPLYNLVAEYLEFLNQQDLSEAQVNLSAIQFQIKALATLGLAIQQTPAGGPIWFSLSHGGFASRDTGADAAPVIPADHELFQQLAHRDFQTVLSLAQPAPGLFRLINRFVTYQLERELKAAQFIER